MDIPSKKGEKEELSKSLGSELLQALDQDDFFVPVPPRRAPPGFEEGSPRRFSPRASQLSISLPANQALGPKTAPIRKELFPKESPPRQRHARNKSVATETFDHPSEKEKKLSLYKTELCRSWEETGSCRYGNKCQFAHSQSELRIVDRHPKYKTEMCRTFWEKGSCPYGKRCCFIHTSRAEYESQKQGLAIRTNVKQDLSFHSPRVRSISDSYGELHSPLEVKSAVFDTRRDPVFRPLSAHPDTSSDFFDNSLEQRMSSLLLESELDPLTQVSRKPSGRRIPVPLEPPTNFAPGSLNLSMMSPPSSPYKSMWGPL